MNTHLRTKVNTLLWATLFGLLVSCVPMPLPPTNAGATDFRYVADTARQVHPALNGGPTRQAFDLLAQALEAKITADATPVEVYALSSRLLGSLRDAHSLVFPNHSERNLPLRFAWLGDGLVIEQAVALSGVAAGDEVIRLGGLTPNELCERLRMLIPAENDGHIRALGAWFLSNAMLLEAIGVVQDGAVRLELRHANGVLEQVKMILSSARPETTARPPFGWKLEPGYGRFWLDSCDDTPEYRQSVQAFFKAVSEAHLKRVAIDVRRNAGGDSQVLNTLLEYLPADTIRVFHRPERDGLMTVAHPNPDWVFRGEVFVLTGPFTFSSANWIAGTIRDNRLGRTVGEMTGNAPTSFGNVRAFTTPNLKLGFQVSQTLWVRPDLSFDPAIGLEADVLVPTTVQDIQRGHDPVFAWLASPM